MYLKPNLFSNFHALKHLCGIFPTFVYIKLIATKPFAWLIEVCQETRFNS